MSHWAKIENNIVVEVLVGPNYGDEGEAFFKGLGGTWVKTSYNGNIRRNFAGVGYTYDSENDWFVAPQPYPSWKLSHVEVVWKAPKPIPNDGNQYEWDEKITDWKLSIKEIN
jgi:hypothetical protein